MRTYFESLKRIMSVVVYMTIGARLLMIANQTDRVEQWETLVGYLSWLLVLFYMLVTEGRVVYAKVFKSGEDPAGSQINSEAE